MPKVFWAKVVTCGVLVKTKLYKKCEKRYAPRSMECEEAKCITLACFWKSCVCSYSWILIKRDPSYMRKVKNMSSFVRMQVPKITSFLIQAHERLSLVEMWNLMKKACGNEILKRRWNYDSFPIFEKEEKVSDVPWANYSSITNFFSWWSIFIGSKFMWMSTAL